MFRRFCDPGSPLALLPFCLAGVLLISPRFWAETPGIQALHQQAREAAGRKDYTAAASLYERF